jgi:hypothetical protein
MMVMKLIIPYHARHVFTLQLRSLKVFAAGIILVNLREVMAGKLTKLSWSSSSYNPFHPHA